MNIKPVYITVRNVRHILKNHQIISQIVIVNGKLLNIWTIVVVIQFIPRLNLIISVMSIVNWMIAKFVMFGVWKFLSVYKQITFECIHFLA